MLELLEICLKNNNFYFGENCYLQTKGIAMGKKFAHALDNLYLTHFHQVACEDLNGVQLIYYFRFLDDIFHI